MKTLVFTDASKLWFISDTHFHHDNIIRYCDRPFENVGHMDKTMIENWCSLVQPDDFVIHAGDFCWGNTESWIHFLAQLPGNIILVRGNHDKDGTFPKNRFHSIHELLNIRVKDPEIEGGDQRITICHYPMLSWYQSHRGAWQFFGHVHGKLVDSALSPDGWNLSGKLTPKQLDLSVELHNYSPISYNEVKIQITRQVRRSS